MRRLRYAVLALLLVAAVVLGAFALNRAGGPYVIILAPLSNSQFRAGDQVKIEFVATDSSGITRVELLVDGSVVGTISPQKPSVLVHAVQIWTAVPGTHTLSARAFNKTDVSSSPAALVLPILQRVLSVEAAPALLDRPGATPSPLATIFAQKAGPYLGAGSAVVVQVTPTPTLPPPTRAAPRPALPTATSDPPSRQDPPAATQVPPAPTPKPPQPTAAPPTPGHVPPADPPPPTAAPPPAVTPKPGPTSAPPPPAITPRPNPTSAPPPPAPPPPAPSPTPGSSGSGNGNGHGHGGNGGGGGHGHGHGGG